jgi:hypothetical protein
MITLTEKEIKLTQFLLDNTDGTDCHILNKEWEDQKELGWSFETLRGVYASLIDKKLLCYVDQNENGEIYQWSVSVSGEQQNYDDSEYQEIDTVEKYLQKLNKEGN